MPATTLSPRATGSADVNGLHQYHEEYGPIPVPEAQLAVLPTTTHMQLTRRAAELAPMLERPRA
jgi:hypothetical protein